MASSSSTSDPTPPYGNPYKILSLPNFATNTQIKKAFRDLSRKLHPDKRKQNQNQNKPITEIQAQAQKKKLDEQFINVQEAKSFLLDVENANLREKYDAKLRSENARVEEDRRREEMMDGKRKSMRDELQEKIQKERNRKNGRGDRRGDGHGDENQDHVEGLKKAGKRMREAYDEKRHFQEQQNGIQKRKRRKKELQNRQIRLKWSRAKIGGQSEHMIAKLLSEQFGNVEDVELIGRKGNAALVTFLDAKSCQPCVDAYLQSNKMRATFVGKRKGEEGGNDGDGDDHDDILASSMHRERDRESVEERKLRQEAEREKLLRQMQDENYDENNTNQKEVKDKGRSKSRTKHKSLFPPHFPSVGANERGERLSYFERLEEMERIILKDLISPGILRSAQT